MSKASVAGVVVAAAIAGVSIGGTAAHAASRCPTGWQVFDVAEAQPFPQPTRDPSFDAGDDVETFVYSNILPDPDYYAGAQPAFASFDKNGNGRVCMRWHAFPSTSNASVKRAWPEVVPLYYFVYVDDAGTRS